MNYLRFNLTRPILLVSALMLMAVGYADVKVVSHMKADVMGKTTERDTTTYYKGDKLRVDSGDTVTIYDVATKKSIVIDNAKKTYYEVSGDDVQSPMAGMKVSATATVIPTEEKAKIAGYSCSKFIADMAIEMSMDQNGGFTAKTDMHMEIWTSTELKTPFSSQQMMYMVTQMFRGAIDSAGTQKLSDEMGKIHGFPLDTKITMTIGGIPGMTASPKIEIGSVVQSVSEDPLADSMFQAPSDYTKVERAKRKPSGGGGR